MTLTVGILAFATVIVQSFVASSAFSLRSTPSNLNFKSINSKLSGFIAADSTDEQDLGIVAEGIKLAEDNAILFTGKVDKKGNPIATKMAHYSEVTPIKTSNIDDRNINIVCKGDGMEQYSDPGQSTNRNIILAPLEAVENALSSIELELSKFEHGKIIINFAGDDMVVSEIFDGVQKMISGLDLMTKNNSRKIEFHSLCASSVFQKSSCGVVVAQVPDDEDSLGQLYYQGGSWFTLSDDNIIE